MHVVARSRSWLAKRARRILGVGLCASLAAGLLLVSVMATTELVSAQETAASSQLNVPPAGFAALFNGRDLTGWKGLVGGAGDPFFSVIARRPES